MTIKSIDAKELKKMLDQKEKFLLLDVREQEEWNDGHIEKAVFAPLSIFEDYVDDFEKDEKIVLQCRSGKRSMTAAKILEENGFSNLTNLSDGIIGWVNNGFKVIKG